MWDEGCPETTNPQKYIYSYLSENKNERQFTLTKLVDEVKSVNNHLPERAGEKIMFQEVSLGHKVLLSYWYEWRNKKTSLEVRLKV